MVTGMALLKATTRVSRAMLLIQCLDVDLGDGMPPRSYGWPAFSHSLTLALSALALFYSLTLLLF